MASNYLKLKIKKEPSKEYSKSQDYGESRLTYGIKEEWEENSNGSNSQDVMGMGTASFKKRSQKSSAMCGSGHSNTLNELEIKFEPVDRDDKCPENFDCADNWKDFETKHEKEENSINFDSQNCENLDKRNFNENSQNASTLHSADLPNQNVCSHSKPFTPGADLSILGNYEVISKHNKCKSHSTNEFRDHESYKEHSADIPTVAGTNNCGSCKQSISGSSQLKNLMSFCASLLDDNSSGSKFKEASGNKGNADSSNIEHLEIKSESVKEGGKPQKCVEYGVNWLHYEIKEEKNHNEGDSASQAKVNVAAGNIIEDFPQKSSVAHAYWCVEHICPDSLPSTSGFGSQNQGNLTELSDQSFSESSQLMNRLKGRKNKKPHSCKFCGKSFPLYSTLKQHVRIHTGEKPHQCEVCGKKFTHLSYLKSHLIIHTGERPFQCHLCDKKCARSKDLKQHLVVHTGEKLHQCQVCDKKFSQSHSLKHHMTRHTGVKSHCCDICHKLFSSLKNLKAHVRIHASVKPYQCQVCHKEFTQSSNLKQHIKVHK